MDIAFILEQAVSSFKNIRGVAAIVLGGSHATGTATVDSDIDIGIYYDGTFDLHSFQQAAVQIDDAHRKDCITGLGEWGPWINGGGWLLVNGMAVDILFRDVQKVSACIEDCLNGKITIDYQCGHPFGFVNAIYMGEVYCCKILHAWTDAVLNLQKRLSTFPKIYQQAAIQKFLWECEFSLICGQKCVKKADVICASGSLFRSACCLIQALYAYNEMYCLNEKGSLKRLNDSAAALPDRFAAALENTMLIDPANMAKAFDDMAGLLDTVRRFCADKVEKGL